MQQKQNQTLQSRLLGTGFKQSCYPFRSAPLQVPPGLTLCQKELAQVAGAFVRLVAYNRSVFGEFYADIIDNHVLFQESEERREV